MIMSITTRLFVKHRPVEYNLSMFKYIQWPRQ